MRLVFLLLLPFLLPAHDIPVDVTVQAYLKPEASRLRLLVRVPLRSMRDVLFPEYKPGYLDVAALAPKLPELAMLWLGDFAAVYEGETRLGRPTVAATQIAIESDRSFESYEQALAHFGQPLPPNTADLVWNQVWFDVLLEYPIRSAEARFSIHPGWRHLAASTITVLRYVTPDGTIRAFQFHNDPGLVALDPSWHQAAWHFVKGGFEHILDGTDHLLFLLCLVIPFRRLRALILVVTAFTLAHSVTLFASAFDMAPDALWFPPLIETLIAASIVYMALENIAGAGSIHRRWMIAFGFGLVHGFGFSFALRETLQFAGSHLLTSLVCFNIGVELGQLLVLVLLIPLLNLLFSKAVAERMGTVLLSAIVAHTAWHWMADRFEALRKYSLVWPAFDAAFFVAAMRWAAAFLLLAMLLSAGRRWLTMKDNAS